MLTLGGDKTSPDHAFLQGTMQHRDETAQDQLNDPPPPKVTSAEVNQDVPPAQQHHRHEVSPPAIGGAAGASPMYEVRCALDQSLLLLFSRFVAGSSR